VIGSLGILVMPLLVSLQMFLPGKAGGASVALEVLLKEVDRADVSLVALLPGELHAAVLALELFL